MEGEQETAAPSDVLRRMRGAARRLARDVAPLRFGAPVHTVYNPLDYAWRAHAAYLALAATGRRRVVLLGMNPGPFGMAQTGVPFGDATFAREWLGLHARVDRPAREHPRRPVLGFDCPRSEVSGTRLWGAVARHWGTPARFFAGHFVANYCPLLFLEASGRNRTPDQLPAAERAPLYAVCDAHLRRVVRALEPEWLIGVGAFAETRAREVLAGSSVRVGRILHPSPASPRANRDWSRAVAGELRALGVCEPGGFCAGERTARPRRAW